MAVGCGYGCGLWAVPGSFSSNRTPSLGTSICHKCSPKKQKEKKEERDGKRKGGEKAEREKECSEYYIHSVI